MGDQPAWTGRSSARICCRGTGYGQEELFTTNYEEAGGQDGHTDEEQSGGDVAYTYEKMSMSKDTGSGDQKLGKIVDWSRRF